MSKSDWLVNGKNLLQLLFCANQCDQIGRFFALLATIQKLVATIILPKLATLSAIFVKVSKPFIFLLKSFLDNFDRHLAIFIWSHCIGSRYWRTALHVWPCYEKIIFTILIIFWMPRLSLFRTLVATRETPGNCNLGPHL